MAANFRILDQPGSSCGKLRPAVISFRPCSRITLALLTAAVAVLLLFALLPARAGETLTGLQRIAKQNLVTIPVQLNGGAAVPFALDSGASSTIVNERLAVTLHLKQGNTFIGQGAGTGDCTLRELLQVRVRAGPDDIGSSVFAAPLEPLERFMGLRMNGIVGGALFLTHIVSIDYRTRKAHISKTTNFVPEPTDARISVSPSGLLCCIANAEIELHGTRRRARLLIDTGALPFEIVLTREFALHRRIAPDSRTEILEAPGLCGMSRIAKTVGITHIPGLPSLSVTIFISSDNKGALSSANFDGVIGSELLRRLGTVIFDAPHNRVLFRRDRRDYL